jgi:hypothetical protein
MTKLEQVWLSAYNSAIAGGKYSHHDAKAIADACLGEFKVRFPQ